MLAPTEARSPHRRRASAAWDRPFTLTLDFRTPRLVLSRRTPNGLEAPLRRQQAQRLVTLEGARARALMPAVLETLHTAGFPVWSLEERGLARLRLGEAVGARLALLLWALAPIQKPSRAAMVRAGIAAMVDEEVYYWYAKAQGAPRELGRRRRQNALKALRVLLAGG